MTEGEAYLERLPPDSNAEEPDNLDAYRTGKDAQAKKSAQPKEKPFLSDLPEETVSAMRPNPSVQFRGRQGFMVNMGLSRDHVHEENDLLKSLDAELVRKIAAIKDFINTNGQRPSDVLLTSASNPHNVTFVGVDHGNNDAMGGAESLLSSVLEKALPSAIFAAEVPDALKPLFEQYNNSSKDTKFTLPDNLEELVGKKAAAYCRFDESIMGRAALFEAAHKRGIKISPVDDSAVMSVMDVKVEEMWTEINHYTRGGSRNPAREEKIAGNILDVARAHPDSPIIVHFGRSHAAEHSPVARTAARRLASFADFQETGKQIVSFGITDFDQEFDGVNPTLFGLRQDLYRAVCFPGLDTTGKSPLAELPEYADASADKYDAYDYVIFMHSKTKDRLPVPDKSLPANGTRNAFLQEGVSPIQKESIGAVLPLGREKLEQISAIYTAHAVRSADISQLRDAINQEGEDPKRALQHLMNNPRALLFIDQRASQLSPFVRPESPVAVRSALLADVVNGSSPGAILAVDMPMMVRGIIGRYNRSPTGTPFSSIYKDPEWQRLVKDRKVENLVESCGSFGLEREKVYEAAHNRGIQIAPFGTDQDIPLGDRVERQTISEEYASTICTMAAENPQRPVMVWGNRGTSVRQLNEHLIARRQFQALQRDVNKVGMVGTGIDPVAPLCMSLTRPVSLDLSRPSLAYLNSKCVSTMPINPTTSYRDCSHMLNNRLGENYDYIIMFPNHE